MDIVKKYGVAFISDIKKNNPFWLAFFINAIFLIVTMYVRPLVPIDETRYISVAWEMNVHSSFLVPLLNQAPYFHKPPLLFWLINFSWFIFGDSEVAARAIISLFSLGNLVVIYYLAKVIYPNNVLAQRWSSLVLTSFLLWTVFCTTLMFDCLLTFFVLLNVMFMLLFLKRQQFIYIVLAGLMGGLSMLAKGPVALIYSLPIFIAYPLWRDKNRYIVSASKCYLGLGLSILIATVIILGWALPAALHGGFVYAKQLLWVQTVDRMSGTLAHSRSWYWYLPLIPLSLAPLTLATSFWKIFLKKHEGADLFCMLWALIPFILLSVIGGKQWHYLIPVLPPLAILFASKQHIWYQRSYLFIQLILVYFISGVICLLWPYLCNLLFHADMTISPNQCWAILPLTMALTAFLLRHSDDNLDKIALSILPICALALLGASKDFLYSTFSMEPAAQEIVTLQKENKTVVMWEKYEDQYHFFGKLRGKIDSINSTDWLEKNLNTIVLVKSARNNAKLTNASIVSFHAGLKEIYYIPATKFLSLSLDKI